MSSLHYKSSKVWSLAIHISLCVVFNNLSLFSMNTSIENISATLNWESSYLSRSIFPSLYPIGIFLGTLTAVPLSSKYGIRRVIIASDSIFIFSSILSMIPTNLTLALGRSVSGIIGGILVVVPPIFINEMTPDQMTGSVGTLIQQCTGFAVTLSYALGLALPTTDLKTDPNNIGWVFILGSPILICLYQISYFLLVFKHENPVWYLRQERKDEALEALKFVYFDEFAVDGVKRLSFETGNESLLGKKPSLKQIFTWKAYRKMIRITLILNLGQQITGSFAIILFSTSMFKEMGGSIFYSKLLTLVQGLVIFIAGLLSIPLLKVFGRKVILVAGCFICGAILLALAIFIEFYSAGPVFSSFLVFAYLFFFVISMGSTFWTYLAEICVDQVFGIGLSLNLFSCTVVSMIFPIGIHYYGVSIFFFGFSVSCFLLAGYLMVDSIETMGLSKQEINIKLQG